MSEVRPPPACDGAPDCFLVSASCCKMGGMIQTDINQSGVDTDAASGALAERIVASAVGALECHAAYLGDKLGWYDAIAAAGSVTAPELADRTATDARYAQEWLEHQTVSGFLAVDDASAVSSVRRYSFPPGHREVLTDRDHLAFSLPFATICAGFGKQLEPLVEAYRTGGGVSWQQHGDDARQAQAAANRPMFLHRLGQEFLASMPEVRTALERGGHLADVGCGFGWSSIGIAMAYPDAKVDGFDVDSPSIDTARANAVASGVSDRVTFHTVDAGAADGLGADGGYDVVIALECIHDLSDPVGVLGTMRRLAGDKGVVLVMDEAVGHEFTGEDDVVERLMYGFSLVCCLPDGRSHTPSVATGTVMRPATLERYAVEAGFSGVDELPIDADLFRFYQLR